MLKSPNPRALSILSWLRIHIYTELVYGNKGELLSIQNFNGESQLCKTCKCTVPAAQSCVYIIIIIIGVINSV